jgi:glycosyltransferase involved in cell wall biosynthesis
MKKILIINYEFPPLGGGGGRVSLSLAKGFRDRGYGVDILTSRYRGLSGKEDVEGITVYRVPILGRTAKQTATFISMLSFLVSGFLFGAMLCMRNRYSFINTHFVVPTGPLGFALAALFRKRNILSLMGGDIYDPSKKSSPHNTPVMRSVVRFLLNHAYRAVALSSDIQKNTVHYYVPDREPAIIVHCYQPFSFTPVSKSALKLEEKKKYLISVGRLVKRKGFDYLIRSLRYLPEDIELILIGDGSEKNSLLELTEESGLAKRVHFVGEISEEKKFQYLDCATLYVLSSLHEGLGIVLQEAMQVGLPIVSTNYGGQVDLITNQVNGLLVEPEKVEILAEAIKRLLRDINLYKKISCNNIEKVKEFRTDTIIHEYLKLIEAV